MLADNFTKILAQITFKDKQIQIRNVDIKKNNWVKILGICNKDNSNSIFYSNFYLFFIYNNSIRLQNLEKVLWIIVYIDICYLYWP